MLRTVHLRLAAEAVDRTIHHRLRAVDAMLRTTHFRFYSEVVE